MLRQYAGSARVDQIGGKGLGDPEFYARMTLMKMKRTLFVGLVAVGTMLGSAGLAIAKSGEPLDLDPLMGGKAVWEMTDTEFAEKYIKEDEFASFEWVSSAKASARLEHLSRWRITSFDGESKKMTPTIGKGEHEIGEVIVRFEDNKIQRVEMSVYNRGDDGPTTQAIFKDKLTKITAFLDANLSVRKEVRNLRREVKMPCKMFTEISRARG